MEIKFVRHEPCYDRVLLVLVLDRQKMKERIIIGREPDVRLCLHGSPDAGVLCDTARPLGSFLVNFEHDPGGEWNLRGLSPLREALHSNRWRQPALEKAAGDFLQSRYETGDPLRMYAAFRIWNGYLLAREPREQESACERFMDRMRRLTGAFMGNPPLDFDEESSRPKPLDLPRMVFGSIPMEDTRLDLWYLDGRQTVECVAAYASLYPLAAYYLKRLSEWGLCFRKCKICGRVFLANSQRYELCGEKCRKKQALRNKREFDERARENSYDLLYKNECQGWRNKINKAKKNAAFPAERLEEMQSAFDGFKKEALQRKQAVKTGKASPKEFTDWLYRQNSIIVGLSEIS